MILTSSFIITFHLLRVGLINPEREYIKTPDDYSISNYKDHTIVTDDGFKIAAWEFTPTKRINSNKPLLIISCGDAGNMSYHTHPKVLSFECLIFNS